MFYKHNLEKLEKQCLKKKNKKIYRITEVDSRRIQTTSFGKITERNDRRQTRRIKEKGKLERF